MLIQMRHICRIFKNRRGCNSWRYEKWCSAFLNDDTIIKIPSFLYLKLKLNTLMTSYAEWSGRIDSMIKLNYSNAYGIQSKLAKLNMFEILQMLRFIQKDRLLAFLQFQLITKPLILFHDAQGSMNTNELLSNLEV